MSLCSIAESDWAKRLQAKCMRPNGAGVDWHRFTLMAAGHGIFLARKSWLAW